MIHTILTDIEGTTTSISFVHDILFPYSRSAISQFLTENLNNFEVSQILKNLWESNFQQHNQTKSTDFDLTAIVSLLHKWIDTDQKETHLKRLQGMIWKEGYEKSKFKSHIYPDVPPKLRSWRGAGKRLAVYSSGSIEAQKLLFPHTEFGNLVDLFGNFFDTNIGAKRDVDSYRRIAAALKERPAQILFLSDVSAELDAAKIAGFLTHQICRDGLLEQSAHPHSNSFTEIQLPTKD